MTHRTDRHYPIIRIFWRAFLFAVLWLAAGFLRPTEAAGGKTPIH